ncbi:glycosyltransferase family 39 protein [Blastococcus sp. CT_GayMR16]|uniref:glycosyltransferase family 39 protein n=1 Tax=Blastococcus sp. CT_GayMR16 TaxID=2559607 RepID=UPI0010734B39|nr:glycosyltransferase family 39 protein [Blastococcus sp. CT_GayMR16]TFV89998.1 glycosyltransferase [Blastococcus sp. CT_GayMR16]
MAAVTLSRPATSAVRPLPRLPGDELPEGAEPPRPRGGARLRSLLWLVPLLALTGLVQGINLTGAPQRFDDEGTYVAQAFAVGTYGDLAHYTYFYDHPPLGWLQMAGWTQLTAGFSRYEEAVTAGREFMLVCTLVAAGLLWLLARRLEMSRPAAAAAVAIFALSPLAVQFHRSVYLDNIATPWLLAAFVLALPRREQLAGYAGAAAAFGVAVLTKETYLLFLPFLAWQMWRGAHPSTRRYVLPVAGTVFVLVGSVYVLMAALKHELLPSAGRTSLWDGVWFQLVDRPGSGWLADTSSAAYATVGIWWRLDPLLIVAALLAARFALHVRHLLPLAAAFLTLVAFMFRPGYLPVPYVVPLIPLAALLVPGTVEAFLGRALRSARPHARRFGLTAVATVAAAGVGFAGASWQAPLDALLTTDQDRPMRQAQEWLEEHADRDDRLIVDDAMWVDLVRAGFDRAGVVWYYKVDTDPSVVGRAPDGWSDYDYVVVTESMRRLLGDAPVLDDAIRHASTVVAFGTGTGMVEVLEVAVVDPDVATGAAGPATAATATASSAVP